MTVRPGDDRGRPPAPGPRQLAEAEGLPDLITHEPEGASAGGTVLALLVMAALGIGVAFVAPGYGLDVDGERIGPGFLPLVAGVGLALLSLVQLASQLRGAAAARRERGAGTEPHPATDTDPEESADVLGRTSADRTRNMRLVTAAIVVTVLLIPVIGFLESFLLLLLFVSIVVERRPVLPAVAITLVAVTVVYVIFVVLLNVRLPMGALALIGG